jgi:hypothetical protein
MALIKRSNAWRKLDGILGAPKIHIYRRQAPIAIFQEPEGL